MLREQYTNGTKFFCRNFSYVYILRLNDECIQLVQEMGHGDSVDHYFLSYCSLYQLRTGEHSEGCISFISCMVFCWFFWHEKLTVPVIKGMYNVTDSMRKSMH